jgi:hypothetical protein
MNIVAVATAVATATAGALSRGRLARLAVHALGLAFFLAASFFIAPAGAQEFGFGAVDSADTKTGIASGVAIAGSAELRLRGYLDTTDFAATALEAKPLGRLDFSWTSSAAEAKFKLKLDPAALAANPASILDEAWLSAYLGAFEIKAGLFRTIWGKGDSLHVLDVLDPTDYTDFINSDPKYSKIAQATIKADLRTSENGKLELAYLPIFRGNAIPWSGRWIPASLKILATTLASPFYYNTTAPVNLATALAFPATDTLRWGQAGARLTDSLGGIDLGLQYYYGFLRDPVIDMNPAHFAALPAPKRIPVTYDRIHQVGADAAFVLAGFNFRAEAALDLTNDLAGDNYLVHNRSLGWTAGVDREILGFGVNLQTLGTWILNHDKITLPYDIQAGSSEFSNLLALRLSKTLFNEKLGLEAVGVWIVGTGDFIVKPKISWTFPGEFLVSAEGAWFQGAATGEFGQYAAQKYIELAFTLPF